MLDTILQTRPIHRIGPGCFCLFDLILYVSSTIFQFVLFDLILYVPSTIFQLNRDGSSWVEPVLSYDKCVLLKDASDAQTSGPSVSSQALYH